MRPLLLKVILVEVAVLTQNDIIITGLTIWLNMRLHNAKNKQICKAKLNMAALCSQVMHRLEINLRQEAVCKSVLNRCLAS